MDLKAFFFQNVQESEYHYRFREAIENVDKVYNIFVGYTERDMKCVFDVYDSEEAIAKFKELCQPEHSFDNESTCWFYLVTYYLYKQGYVIRQFPRLLERPPIDPTDFTYKQIRNSILSDGDDDNGTVRYVTRRKFVANLTFELKPDYIDIDDLINREFVEISNRGASFDNMCTDERLEAIANLIEHLLKKGKKFSALDYSSVCFEYISNDIVTSYRRKMNCFRHASKDALDERKSYTEAQKSFLVDYGLTIVKAIHSLLN